VGAVTQIPSGTVAIETEDAILVLGPSFLLRFSAGLVTRLSTVCFALGRDVIQREERWLTLSTTRTFVPISIQEGLPEHPSVQLAGLPVSLMVLPSLFTPYSHYVGPMAVRLHVCFAARFASAILASLA